MTSAENRRIHLTLLCLPWLTVAWRVAPYKTLRDFVISRSVVQSHSPAPFKINGFVTKLPRFNLTLRTLGCGKLRPCVPCAMVWCVLRTEVRVTQKGEATFHSHTEPIILLGRRSDMTK